MLPREDMVFMAKSANKVQRYADMLDWMKKIGTLDQSLSTEERNLLHIAYKKCISAKRDALKLIIPIKLKEETKPNPKLQVIKEVKDSIEEELTKLCADAVNFTEQLIASKKLDKESEVFFSKMKGDFHRYVLEFIQNESARASHIKELNKAYKNALEIAENLKATHPLRLNVSLNYAIYFFEIEKKTQDACNLAMTAFEQATQEMAYIDEGTYQDTMKVMQLIRDNVSTWTNDKVEIHESES